MLYGAVKKLDWWFCANQVMASECVVGHTEDMACWHQNRGQSILRGVRGHQFHKRGGNRHQLSLGLCFVAHDGHCVLLMVLDEPSGLRLISSMVQGSSVNFDK